MPGKSKKTVITVEPDLTDFVVLQATANIKSRLARTDKIKDDARNVYLSAMGNVMNYLKDGSFLSTDGFFADIADEYENFVTAYEALRKKIMDVSVLYLDDEGKPHPKQTYWPNNSSDAD